MKSFKLIFLLVAIIFASKVLAAETKIGIILRLEDKYNEYIKHIKDGAVFLHNTRKHSSKLLFYSHEGTYESIQIAIDKATKDGVQVILGAETSSDGMLMSRLTALSKIPIITPTASSHKIQQFNPNVYRISHDDKNIHKMVEEIIKKLKISEIDVFHNLSKPNTDFIAKSIINMLSKNKIKFDVFENLSDADISEKATQRLVSSTSKYLCLFAFESDLRKIYSIFSKYNKKMIYLGADGWGSNESVFKKYITESENKDLFTGIRLMYWNNTSLNERLFKIKDRFKKKLKIEMNEFHAIGYDSMKIILDSLDQNKGKFDRDHFIASLKTSVFNNLLTTNKLSFDSEKAAIKDMHVFKIDKSGIHYWDAIKF